MITKTRRERIPADLGLINGLTRKTPVLDSRAHLLPMFLLSCHSI